MYTQLAAVTTASLPSHAPCSPCSQSIPSRRSRARSRSAFPKAASALPAVKFRMPK
jgi:hypothetical protein